MKRPIRIKAPREFTTVVMAFYAGSDDGMETHEEWIASTLRDFTTPEMREVVRALLDGVLNENYSDEELEDLWMAQGPGINFSKGGHRWFLEEIRRVLNWKWPKGTHPR